MKIKINKVKSHDLTQNYGITDSVRTKESIAWYSVGTENFITADILLRNDRISHSVFFMQQCIEAIIKGIMLENKIVDKAKNLNHSPEEAFKMVYKQLNSESEQICAFVDKKFDGKSIFSERLLVACQVANIFTIIYNGDISKYVKDENANINMEFILSQNSDEIKKYFYVDNLLYCLAVLFHNSQQDTRYPSSDYNQLPNDYYKSENKEKLCFIIKLLDYILNSIKNF